jgi:hypothetical protein
MIKYMLNTLTLSLITGFGILCLWYLITFSASLSFLMLSAVFLTIATNRLEKLIKTAQYNPAIRYHVMVGATFFGGAMMIAFFLLTIPTALKALMMLATIAIVSGYFYLVRTHIEISDNK